MTLGTKEILKILFSSALIHVHKTIQELQGHLHPHKQRQEKLECILCITRQVLGMRLLAMYYYTVLYFSYYIYPVP